MPCGFIERKILADIIYEKQDRLGLIKLNRPKALNAINQPMLESLEKIYAEFEKNTSIYIIVQMSTSQKAFCAGADVRQLYQDGLEKNGREKLFFDHEYAFNWQLDRFNKPNIALWNGIVMGGGVGASIYGSHRVAGSNLQFAMPETSIGLFPDVGAAWFYNRMSPPVGLYLALTGKVLDQADAYHYNLVTHYIPEEHWENILVALQDATPVDPLLDSLHQDPGASAIAGNEAIITQIFSSSSLTEIFDKLEKRADSGEKFASETLTILKLKSPLALRVTFDYMRHSRELSLQQVLQNDLLLMKYMIEQQDFFEGVRALLIDKDKSPQWQFKNID